MDLVTAAPPPVARTLPGRVVALIENLSGIFSRKPSTRALGYWALYSVFDRLGELQGRFVAPLRVVGRALAARTLPRWFAERVLYYKSKEKKPKYFQFPKIYDLVFIVPKEAKGWILEGICQDVAKEFSGTSTLHWLKQYVPKARAYFIAHYSQLDPISSRSPYINDAKRIVWFTHPRDDLDLPMRFYARLLNSVDYVFLHNEWAKRHLIENGTREEKLFVVTGAIDPNLFQPHARSGRGKVGFCTGFYDRKRPDLVLDLVKALPHRDFVLLGRNWRNWNRFEELVSHKNLEYVETEFTNYPKYYEQMDVFVSPAMLEGGPFPLLEAMASNVVPVASRTGFAPDLIRPGDNGFLFDPRAPVQDVAPLVERAFGIHTDVASGVRHFTWRRFAMELERILCGLPPRADNPLLMDLSR